MIHSYLTYTRGEHLEKGKKSIAIRLSYLDTENTLTDERVNAVHDKILEALKSMVQLLDNYHKGLTH